MNATQRLAAALAGRYLVEREIGQGGMATVFRARDLRQERDVAIKLLHEELAGAIGGERFAREVRLASRLSHPRIVPVLDSGVLPATPGSRPVPWYAMPLIAGETLRERLVREAQLPIDEAIRIACAVADALAAAHRVGIVHRDVKPENIMLGADGEVHVVDFGIARALLDTGGDRLTSTGFIIGTPAYMSPEQASSGPLDGRSDQYALATVLYEMLAGEPPFTGATVQAVVARRLAEPARPLRTLRPTVPAEVEQVILRALERVPADRWPDVAAFSLALRDAATPVTTLLPTARRPRARRPRAFVGATVAATLLVAAGVGAWRFAARGPRRHVPNPEVVALYQQGVRAYEKRTPASSIVAVRDLDAAVRRDSAFTDAWTALARAYVRAYIRYHEIPGVSHDSVLRLAVAAADGAVLADSASAAAWFARASVSKILDPTDLSLTQRALRRALAIDSTQPEAWHQLAVVRAESGDLEGALETWRRSIRIAANTENLSFLAMGHYWRRQYDSARVWADSAVTVDPSNFLVWHATGLAALERGDFARAEAAFDAARRVATKVEAMHAIAGLVMTRARAGRRDEALATLRDADSLARAYLPLPVHTAVFMSQAYAAVGHADSAVAWLRRYEPRRDLHFQLHLRCDPPFDPIAGDERFRALVLPPGRPERQGC